MCANTRAHEEQQQRRGQRALVAGRERAARLALSNGAAWASYLSSGLPAHLIRGPLCLWLPLLALALLC